MCCWEALQTRLLMTRIKKEEEEDEEEAEAEAENGFTLSLS